MDPAHDRTDRHTLGLGDVLVTQPRLGEQDEGGPDRGTQPVEGLIEGPPEVLLVDPASGMALGIRLVAVFLAVTLRKAGRPFASPPPVGPLVLADPRRPGPEPAPAIEFHQGRERLIIGLRTTSSASCSFPNCR